MPRRVSAVERAIRTQRNPRRRQSASAFVRQGSTVYNAATGSSATYANARQAASAAGTGHIVVGRGGNTSVAGSGGSQG